MFVFAIFPSNIKYYVYIYIHIYIHVWYVFHNRRKFPFSLGRPWRHCRASFPCASSRDTLMLAPLSRQSVLMVSPPLPMRTPGRRGAGASLNPGGMVGFPFFFLLWLSSPWELMHGASCIISPGRSLDDPDGACHNLLYIISWLKWSLLPKVQYGHGSIQIGLWED